VVASELGKLLGDQTRLCLIERGGSLRSSLSGTIRCRFSNVVDEMTLKNVANNVTFNESSLD